MLPKTHQLEMPALKGAGDKSAVLGSNVSSWLPVHCQVTRCALSFLLDLHNISPIQFGAQFAELNIM